MPTPEQVLDAAKHLGTPKAHLAKKTEPASDIRMFMEVCSVKEHWPPIAQWITAHE
jgi:hypothetical protein